MEGKVWMEGRPVPADVADMQFTWLSVCLFRSIPTSLTSAVLQFTQSLTNRHEMQHLGPPRSTYRTQNNCDTHLWAAEEETVKRMDRDGPTDSRIIPLATVIIISSSSVVCTFNCLSLKVSLHIFERSSLPRQFTWDFKRAGS